MFKTKNSWYAAVGFLLLLGFLSCLAKAAEQKPPANMSLTPIEATSQEFDEASSLDREGKYQKAATLYRVLAEKGDARAQARLAIMLENGQGVVKDETEALQWYRKAAEQGHIKAQAKLGHLLSFGAVLDEKRNHEAVQWYRKAAQQGDPEAQYNLGLHLATGLGVEKDEREAAQWMRKAAEQGNTEAQMSLGSMLSTGKGVKRDMHEALLWLHRAADKNPSCSFELAKWYTGAPNFPKDEKESLKLFRQAAEQDTRYAVMLANYFNRGEYVTQNYREAAEWFKRGAIQGDVWAQGMLGHMLKNGRGAPIDMVSAYAWLSLAATANDPPEGAAQALSDLAAQMSAEQISESQRLIREWKVGSDLGKVRIINMTPKKAQVADASDFNPSKSNAGGWPETPVKRPGVTSCNTNCINGDCRRTYDNGRKIRFQAKQKWNPFNNQFEWDSGSC